MLLAFYCLLVKRSVCIIWHWKFLIVLSKWYPVAYRVGSENPKPNSDAISNDIDKDGFMLNPNIFAVADIMWGPHLIDRFSSFKTRQVPRFCSGWLSPFMINIWMLFQLVDRVKNKTKNNWLFPSPSFVSRVIKHLSFSEADATLVVRLWPSA